MFRLGASDPGFNAWSLAKRQLLATIKEAVQGTFSLTDVMVPLFLSNEFGSDWEDVFIPEV